MLDPVGKLVSYWPEVNNAIAKRNKKVRPLPASLAAGRKPSATLIQLTAAQLPDFDAARTKVRKLSDKPSDDPTKLPKV